MKNRLLVCLVSALLFVAILLILKSRNSQEVEFPVGGKREVRIKTIPRHTLATSTSAVSGIGEIPYARRLEDVNFYQLKADNGELVQEAVQVDRENNPDTTVDIYLDEDDEILHVSQNEGNLRTLSRDEAVMKIFTERDGIEFVGVGVGGCTLKDQKLMGRILNTTYFGDPEAVLQITPVMVKTSQVPKEYGIYRQEPREKVGEIIPALLVKSKVGSATGGLFHDGDPLGRWGLQPEDLVRVEWSIRLLDFLFDEEERKQLPKLHGHFLGTEVLESAYRRRKRDNDLPKMIWPEGATKPEERIPVPIDAAFWNEPPSAIYDWKTRMKYYPE